jgi:hypothetical protein
MALSESTETRDSPSARPDSQTPSSNGAAGTGNTLQNRSVSDNDATFFEPEPYLCEALKDAERLLKYVAETGIEVDEEVRKNVLHARERHRSGYTEVTAANLLTALTTLAARVRPVTAESLKACTSETRPTVRSYWIVAICLAIVIVPFSLASFVTSALSEAIRKDIVTANELAVKLRTQLGPPPADSQTPPAPSPLPPGLTTGEVITELQQFASTIRAIDARARQLRLFVFKVEQDPFEDIRHAREDEFRKVFELPPGLTDFASAADQKTGVYQRVRYFAQSLVDDVSVFYGAITTCILPVLYALLGTCAYLLRSFEQQVSSRTFMPSAANSARFLIAAIGGAVVGLFNNFTITQGASIPPLAIAFLAGYAVDVFFSFLEGVIQSFTKSRSGANSPTGTSTT